MAQTFKELREASDSGSALSRLRDQIRPSLGEHKKTRLKGAGRHLSGSLLHPAAAVAHGEQLFADYERSFGACRADNLRYVTILHDLEPLDYSRVSTSAEEMRAMLVALFAKADVRALGVIEIELVNLAFLSAIETMMSRPKRKRAVLEELRSSTKSVGSPTGDTYALVHCHVLVDLGGPDESAFRRELAKFAAWQRATYQTEVKGTFKTRSISDNLKSISQYGTKGGNEDLRYKAGFGREAPGDEDARSWRRGTGRKDSGGETVTDERSLSVWEIEFLDRAYLSLMATRCDNRGYLVGSSDVLA